MEHKFGALSLEDKTKVLFNTSGGSNTAPMSRCGVSFPNTATSGFGLSFSNTATPSSFGGLSFSITDVNTKEDDEKVEDDTEEAPITIGQLLSNIHDKHRHEQLSGALNAHQSTMEPSQWKAFCKTIINDESGMVLGLLEKNDGLQSAYEQLYRYTEGVEDENKTLTKAAKVAFRVRDKALKGRAEAVKERDDWIARTHGHVNG